MKAPRGVGGPLGFLSAWGAVVAGLAVGAVVVWTLVAGPVLFSPGALNALSNGRTLGGVGTHAELCARCEACHTMPWSGQTMGSRCVACHTEVRTQISSGVGLHARIAGTTAAPSCRGCHTDHTGPRGVVTYFDHSKLAFTLTGAHRAIACDLCHGNAHTIAEFRSTPRTCFGCHAKNDRHRGTFGRQCDQCHNTSTWTNARFDHSIFPTNHGSQERVPTCKTCHPIDVSRYTCFGCHAHTPSNVVGEHEGQTLQQLQNCIRCHQGGRTEGGG